MTPREVKRALDVLQAVHKQDAARRKRKKTSVDWSDIVARRAYVAGIKRKKRLASFPKDGRCPRCKGIKITMRQWDSKRSCCKGCATREAHQIKKLNRIAAEHKDVS